MSDWLDSCPEAVRDYIGGERLDEVECIISDLPGIARGKAMPAFKFATPKALFPAELDLLADHHRRLGR